LNIKIHQDPTHFGAGFESPGFPIDSEYFHGRAYFVIAGLPDSPNDFFR
jgi:hypothetical protein